MNSSIIRFFIATFLLFSALHASAINETVSVSLTTREPVIIEIDGKIQNSRPQTQVIISSIFQGVHSLKVYRSSSNSSRPVAVNNQKMIYEGSFYLNRDRSLSISIDARGRATLMEIDPRNNTTNNDKYPEYDYDRNSHNYNDCVPMGSREFDQLKVSLKDRAFDDKKMDLLKLVVTNNYFMTSQVKELVKLFSFNNGQLNVAKLLYPSTVDQEYYYTVGDAFTFNSSKNELDKFLLEQQQQQQPRRR